jgi:hypothetical protein
MLISNPSASFIRPANTTAYAQGQLVANSVTPASVVPMAFTLGNSFGPGQYRMTRFRLFKSGTNVTNASFRLHRYEALPVVTNGDGGTWLTTMSAHWLGNIDVSSMLPFSDGAAGTGSPPAGSEHYIKMYQGKVLYGLLAMLGASAYTPASAEAFTCVLEELDTY